jgi:hypothetical protein
MRNSTSIWEGLEWSNGGWGNFSPELRLRLSLSLSCCGHDLPVCRRPSCRLPLASPLQLWWVILVFLSLDRELAVAGKGKDGERWRRVGGRALGRRRRRCAERSRRPREEERRQRFNPNSSTSPRPRLPAARAQPVHARAVELRRAVVVLPHCGHRHHRRRSPSWLCPLPPRPADQPTGKERDEEPRKRRGDR